MSALHVAQALRGLGLEVADGGTHRHVTARWAGVDCPRCSPGSRKFRLGVSETGRGASCWSCGRLPVVKVLCEASGRTPAEVAGALAGVPRWTLPGDRPERPAGAFRWPDGCGPLQKVHRQYLRMRGLDPAEAERLWGLRATGQLGDPPWSVVVPVMHDGRPASWQARAVGSAGRRYDSARPDQESVPSRRLLLGWDYVRDAAVVHEGPFDVMRTGPGAVAILGMKWSPAQLLMLASVPRRMVCLDSDGGATRRAEDLAAQLALFGGTTLVCRLDSKDAGSATAAETAALRDFLGRDSE